MRWGKRGESGLRTMVRGLMRLPVMSPKRHFDDTFRPHVVASDMRTKRVGAQGDLRNSSPIQNH